MIIGSIDALEPFKIVTIHFQWANLYLRWMMCKVVFPTLHKKTRGPESSGAALTHFMTDHEGCVWIIHRAANSHDRSWRTLSSTEDEVTSEDSGNPGAEMTSQVAALLCQRGTTLSSLCKQGQQIFIQKEALPLDVWASLPRTADRRPCEEERLEKDIDTCGKTLW